MALTAMTARDWKDSLDFSTQEVQRDSLVKRFDTVFYLHDIFSLKHHTPFSMTACDIIHSIKGGGPTGMKDVVAHFKKLNGAKGWGEWEVDQVKTILFLMFLVFGNQNQSFWLIR